MKNQLLIVCLLMALYSFAQKKQSPDIGKVRKVLTDQQQAWNEGNIDNFMQGYWKSDSLKFIGKKGITYGWQQTLDNYKKGYPDRSSMGQLQFDILEIEQFSGSVIYVIGKWTLLREESKGNLGGHFTLLFRKIGKQWVIVSDHTS